LLACRYGARRVYAFECSRNAGLIRELADENAFGDRLVVIDQPIARAKLPEPAHVLSSDPRGVLPPFMGHLRDLTMARRLHLAERGRIIPARCVLKAALVHAPATFEARRRVWASAPHGLRIASALRFVQNEWHQHRAQPDDLRTRPIELATIDYARTTGRVAGSARWTIEQSCRVHGVLVWFDAELGDGVTLSNSPGSAATVHGQALFPWPEATDLGAGDAVSVDLRADPVSTDHVWSWNTRVTDRFGRERMTCRQNDFAARPLNRATLQRRDVHAQRRGLSHAGQAAAHTLKCMDSGCTLNDVADDLCASFPMLFDTVADALDFAARFSDAYGRYE
jgi:protein arginine N-methyltransferase 1